jgi:aconitate hydratase
LRTDQANEPEFTDRVELDLGAVEPSLAGPKRPQDRVALANVKEGFRRSLTASVLERGYGLSADERKREGTYRPNGTAIPLHHGAVVIAAITSCTNTSNPSVMVAAGLVAKKARERGLTVPPYVKTSLAPGSRVVTEYLRASGLLADLEALGFGLVGYGCTTCIGNSGPLPDAVAHAIEEGGLVASAVLSGNRNFEGRIHPLTRANYLASPPLVVAYALAGTTDLDLVTEPLGKDKNGQPVFLRDIWPSAVEVSDVIASSMRPQMFQDSYARVFDGNPTWNALPVPEGDLYRWNPESTYIRLPPFLEGLELDAAPPSDLTGARVLVRAGDSVTTDHISPAGDIAAGSPAAAYLEAHGVTKKDFNSYGSRRGNHEVMMRGTFANIRLKNLLVPGVEGNVTEYLPDGTRLSIFDAAMRYQQAKIPLIVLAGKEYGTGSSRDWAAKGSALLGIRAVLAESFERIHCSNLVGMGVLPLVFLPGESAASHGLTGRETFDITGIASGLTARKKLTVTARGEDGKKTEFQVIARLDTPVAVDVYKNGGILPTVVRKLLAPSGAGERGGRS